MAQPKIEGGEEGIPRMPFGSDGSDWYAILVDSDGHIHIDIETSGLPSGAATEATLAEINNRIGDESAPATGTVNKQLADAVTALQLIDDLRNALASVATDQLRADIISSALPSGAATSAKQDTMITALQLIDDLRNALGSVATDLLRVESKDGDKLVGFESVVEEGLSDTNLATGTNTLDGTAVPTGKVWKITQAMVIYIGTAPSALQIRVPGLGGTIYLLDQRTITSGVAYMWSGEIYLQVGDYMQARVTGATAGDDLYLRYAGLQMNAP